MTVSGRGKFFSFWLFLSAQWAKMWAYRPIFSRFSLISQAREVELRHSKSLKSSTWYGQCRKAMEKCSSLISTAQWAKNVSQLEHTWGQNDSNFRLGENWFVRAGNFLGRSYCLHVANTLMYPLTAEVIFWVWAHPPAYEKAVLWRLTSVAIKMLSIEGISLMQKWNRHL